MFIGSSHVDGSIDERQFDVPTGSLFVAGGELHLITAAYENHAHRWPTLQTAVIEVDEVTLLYDRVRQQSYDLSHVTGRLRLNAWRLPDRGDALTRWRWRIINLLRGRGLAGSYTENRITATNAWQFVLPPAKPDMTPPIPAPKPLDEDAGENQVQTSRDLATDPAHNIAALERLVRMLTARKVNVLLVTFPSHSIYNRVRPKEWDELIARAVKAANAAAERPLPHWDLRQVSLPDNVWNNATHLNRHGAWTFSGKLARQMKDAGLIASP